MFRSTQNDESFLGQEQLCIVKNGAYMNSQDIYNENVNIKQIEKINSCTCLFVLIFEMNSL